MKKIHIGMNVANRLPLATLVIILGMLSMGLAQAAAADWVVTNTADSGSGSLRDCIESAESGDIITFDPDVFYPGSDPILITGGSIQITQGNLTIDGKNTGVIVRSDGSSPGDALGITSNNNVIRGLQILDFTEGAGIYIDGGAYNTIADNVISGNYHQGVCISGASAMGNTVIGNLIGTDASGTAAMGNGTGVSIHDGAQYNVIGGDTPEERNVISGNNRENVGDGVDINGSHHNTVSGNYIGTDITGTIAIPNSDFGVGICCGASYNTIGGDTPEERNVISGNNRFPGVSIFFSETDHNVVSGNYIGTNAEGLAALPNQSGISIWGGAQYNRVGGSTSGERNVISGNADPVFGPGPGVGISGVGTENNTVIGNYIGTDASGTVALGNGDGPQNGAGVAISDGASHNTVGGDTAGERNVISGNDGVGVQILWNASYNAVSGNYIGTDLSGTLPVPNTDLGVDIGGESQNSILANNTIAFNERHGVNVEGSNTLNNTITQNSIHSNGEMGIALENGGNTELPAPVITNIGEDSVSGTACSLCTVEVFSDDEDEGQVYEGTTIAGSDGSWIIEDLSLTGPNFTATATDADGNTSEFNPTVIELTIIGYVTNVHKPDDQFATYLEVIIGGEFPGNLPDDIDAITITAPSGPLGYTKEDFIYYPQWKDFLLSPDPFFYGLLGEAEIGTYTFEVQTPWGTATDTHTHVENVTIPCPDEATFLPPDGAITSLPLTFSWDLIDCPANISCNYRMVITEPGGYRVFDSGRHEDMSSCTVPAGSLDLEQTYKWQVRIYDSAGQNWSHSELSTFTVGNTADNTPEGPDVFITPVEEGTTGETPVKLTFDTVTDAGTTTLATSVGGAPPPLGFKLGQPPTYYEITTTAQYSGQIEGCIDYSGVSFGNEGALKLFHYEDGVWVDVTSSLNTENDIICGTFDSFSSFAIFQPIEVGVCHDHIESMKNYLDSVVFSGKKSETTRDKLKSKLDDVLAKLDEEKFQDALDKLGDFRTEVLELANAPKPKISQQDAARLIEDAESAISCVEWLL